MKVAFDENMPAAMLRVFELFHKERTLRNIVEGVEIESARTYTPQPGDPDYQPKNDVPWIRRYEAAGGRIIISGDFRMSSVPHEKLALVQAGMSVVFFPPKWGQWEFCRKVALLLHWWPIILKQMKTAQPGFYAVPLQMPNDDSELRRLSTEDIKLTRIKRQQAEGVVKREARRAKREASKEKSLFDEERR